MLSYSMVDDIEKFLANEKTYDVWMQTKDNYPIKIGQYQLENKNKTDIYKVIAERPKKLFISEEVLENAVGPGIIIINILIINSQFKTIQTYEQFTLSL
jgi:hypothetical protein